MASAYVHKSIAKKVEQLSSPINSAAKKDEQLYFSGAQGPDFAFFCGKKGGENIGKLLHRKYIYPVFGALLALCRKDETILPYALGICSHYATDVIFHGYIYPAIAGRKSKKIIHAAMERGMDEYFSSLNGEKLNYSFLKAPMPVAKKIASAFSALPIEADFSAKEVCSGFNRFRLYLNSANRLLYYKAAADEKKGWGKLYNSSVELSIKIGEEFISRIDGGDLDKKLFAFNYLGGKI